MSEQPPPQPAQRRGISFLMVLPLFVFLGLAALFWFRLGSGDPSKIPSALIGRPAPQTVAAAARRPRQRRQAGPRARSRRLHRQGQHRQCLGVLVRALP